MQSGTFHQVSGGLSKKYPLQGVRQKERARGSAQKELEMIRGKYATIFTPSRDGRERRLYQEGKHRRKMKKTREKEKVKMSQRFHSSGYIHFSHSFSFCITILKEIPNLQDPHK